MIFGASLDVFTPDPLQTGIVNKPNRDYIKYDLAIRQNNQFSIELWTEYIINKDFCNLHSMSLYNVNNYPFDIVDHLTNDEVLNMFADAYIKSVEKHRAAFKNLNKGNKFENVEVKDKTKQEIREDIKQGFTSMNN